MGKVIGLPVLYTKLEEKLMRREAKVVKGQGEVMGLVIVGRKPLPAVDDLVTVPACGLKEGTGVGITQAPDGTGPPLS